MVLLIMPFIFDKESISLESVIKLFYIKYTKGISLTDAEECLLYFAMVHYKIKYPDKFNEFEQLIINHPNPEEYLKSLIMLF